MHALLAQALACGCLGAAQLAGGTAAATSATLRCSGAGLEISVGDDSWGLLFAAAGTSAATAWTLSEHPSPGSPRCELTATIAGPGGLSYRLRRQVRPLQPSPGGSAGGALEIVESFENLGGSDLALWFNNNITSTGGEPAGCVQAQWCSHVSTVASSCIDVGGLYNLTHSASFGWMKVGPAAADYYNDPPFNPSVFVRGRAAGLGAVAVDDWMRRQLRMYKAGSSAFFGNHMFGVPAHGSANYTWAVFPTPSTDYYDFINLARRGTVPAYRVDGAGSMVPYDFALGWSESRLATLLRALAVKTAIITGPMSTGGSPALGNDGFCNLFTFNITEYLRTIGAACSRLKSIQPGLACLAPFETALSPCQLVLPDGKAPPPAWPDSVVITQNGDPAGYDWKYPTVRAGAKTLNYIYALHSGNSYGSFVADRIQQALHAGMDGFYFDFFDYAMSEEPGRQFRYTYNLSLAGWDNRSVDPAAAAVGFELAQQPGGGGSGAPPRAVARRKADLNWLTTEARAAAIDAALGSTGGLGRFVANGNAAGDSFPIRSRPVVRFWEGCEESGYTATHLSTAPMSLGWYDGYTRNILIDKVHKTSDFWRTWDNCTGLECDRNVFSDIKEKLSFGLLYFSYYNPTYSDFSQQHNQTLTLPSLLTHMYPITVRDIRPGTISGDERIITLHSGTYAFGGGGGDGDAASQTATLFCYAGDGAAVEPRAVSGARGSFVVVVPQDGACVLERSASRVQDEEAPARAGVAAFRNSFSASSQPEGYWVLPQHDCTRAANHTNESTVQCTKKAGGDVNALANCCDADVSCGGFTDIGAIHGADCAEAVRSGDGMLYVKSAVKQSGGALPTATQLAWQEREFGAFVTWQIDAHCSKSIGPGVGEYPGPCGEEPPCWNSTTCPKGIKHTCPAPSAFDISAANFTDEWAASMVDLGVTYAIMVLKQGCGFSMWPTNVSLPSGARYNYSVAFSPTGRDMAAEFIASCHKFGITPGFYMYMNGNKFVGVEDNKLLPGAQITLEAYHSLCLQQLREIWGKYGALCEVWFDGGFDKAIRTEVADLFQELQPDGVAFNGPGSAIGPQNALRWVGSEKGYAPYPNWMSTFRTADSVAPVWGGGDPDGLIYAPPVCDTTFQTPTSTWNWDPYHAQPRSLSDLKQLYHQSVGRSCGLELNFAPMPNGHLAPNFVQRFNEFGGWIRACYGIDAAVKGSKLPVGTASAAALGASSVQISLRANADRVVLQENLKNGQRIRKFNVTDSRGDVLYNGSSLGHKHIAILNRQVTGEIFVTISADGGPSGGSPPKLRRAAAYSNEGC